MSDIDTRSEEGVMADSDGSNVGQNGGRLADGGVPFGCFGIPIRGGAIQYHRVKPGHLVAEVYGLSRRAFRLNVVRSMDDPSAWLLEPCYVYLGVEQEAALAAAFLDGYEGARDPQPSLHAVKATLYEIWRKWIKETRA